MFKKIVLILLLVCFVDAKIIKVAVAANVSYAIDELIYEFNKQYPNIKVLITLGSSGKLTSQIKNGAPYDIFMSADMRYPSILYRDKLAISIPKVYAKGSLAILSNQKRDFTNWQKLLQNKKIRKIAIANSKTAPYGKATIEALKNMKLYDKIKSKFVYGESISQTISYTITSADIGFVAKSSLYSPNMIHFKKNVNWCDVDIGIYAPISQGIVILKRGKNNNDAKAFYDFIESQNAKNIFKRFGYIVS